MKRSLSFALISSLTLVAPIVVSSACSSSSSDNNPTTGDAGPNGSSGDGDGDSVAGDGDGDGDGDTSDAGNGSVGDGDTTSGDGDTTSGDGDTTSGDGDTTTGEPGPGLVVGDVSCLVEGTGDVATAFYFGYDSRCTTNYASEGMLTDQQIQGAEGYCAIFGGTVVEACSMDNVVAYCAGDQFLPGQGPVPAVRYVYDSPVTPDAITVARNALPICEGLKLYDLDDHELITSCTGTVTAMVDGTATDFSEKLFCSWRNDGTQNTYFVRATNAPNSLDSKELTLKIIQDGDGNITFFTEVNTPGFGYLEGATASGAFAYETANTALEIETTSYDATGEGFTGTFSLGEIGGSSNAVRTITDGVIDIQFTVE